MMNVMIKELLLLVVTMTMVSGFIDIEKSLLTSCDVPLNECFVLRNGVRKPISRPGKCPNTKDAIICGYLYPVMDRQSHTDVTMDYTVSDRCSAGDLQAHAVQCSDQCALCCRTPPFNCTNIHSLEQCDIIEQYDLCDKEGMVDYASFFCRATCGRCLEHKFDKPPCDDTYTQCNKLFGMVPCTVPFMYKNCKGTCFVIDDNGCQSEEITGGDNHDKTIYEADDDSSPLIADDSEC